MWLMSDENQGTLKVYQGLIELPLGIKGSPRLYWSLAVPRAQDEAGMEKFQGIKQPI